MTTHRSPVAAEHAVIASIRAAAAKQGLKAHHIAKSADLALYTVQRLFAGGSSPTLATLDSVCSVVGLELVTRAKRSG
jgi:DNA-binding phage protein